MARRRADAEARPSMQGVAAYAGVSIATVSKVMQGVATVLPENVKAVQNAIEALGYRINPLAADLRRGRRKLIGVIVPNLEDGTWGRLVRALEIEAEARGHALATTTSHDSEPREAELVARLLDWRVSGVVVVPVAGEPGPAGLLLQDSGVAAIYLDRVSRGAGFDTVAADRATAVAALAERVTALGHRRVLVAHDKGRGETETALPRLLRDAVAARGGAADLWPLPASAARGRAAMARLLSDPERPSAVLSFAALGALHAVNEAMARGWAVPRDLSVFCFAEAASLSLRDPTIDALETPVAAMATAAMDLLFQRMERPDAPRVDLRIPAALGEGRSLGAAPAHVPADPPSG